MDNDTLQGNTSSQTNEKPFFGKSGGALKIVVPHEDGVHDYVVPEGLHGVLDARLPKEEVQTPTPDCPDPHIPAVCQELIDDAVAAGLFDWAHFVRNKVGNDQDLAQGAVVEGLETPKQYISSEDRGTDTRPVEDVRQTTSISEAINSIERSLYHPSHSQALSQSNTPQDPLSNSQENNISYALMAGLIDWPTFVRYKLGYAPAETLLSHFSSPSSVSTENYRKSQGNNISATLQTNDLFPLTSTHHTHEMDLTPSPFASGFLDMASTNTQNSDTRSALNMLVDKDAQMLDALPFSSVDITADSQDISSQLTLQATPSTSFLSCHAPNGPPVFTSLKSSADQGSLSVSDNSRPYGCPEPGCGRFFTREYTRSVHMLTHRPKVQRPYACTIPGCSDRFTRKHDCLRHEVTRHNKGSEWFCTICSRWFSSEATLERHKLDKHE